MKTQFTSSIARITIFFAVFLRRVALSDKASIRGRFVKGSGDTNTLPNINDGSELFVSQSRNDEASPSPGMQNIGIMPVFKPETFEAPEAAAASDILSYHHGHVFGPGRHTSSLIDNVKVVPIWWGGSAVRYRSNLEHFYGSIVNSSWFSIMNEYKIGMGNLLPSFFDHLAPDGAINGTQIEDRLSSLIASGYIPKPDRNTYYAIHMSPQVTSVTHKGSCSFCANSCGYHSAIPDSWPVIAYGVIPDPTVCKGQCGYPDLDGLTMASSKVLANTVTDSLPSHGFITDGGWEIGDLCPREKGFITAKNGKHYAVQKLWSNKAVKCLSQNPNPTKKPTRKPTKKPARKPTKKPGRKPTKKPTRKPK